MDTLMMKFHATSRRNDLFGRLVQVQMIHLMNRALLGWEGEGTRVLQKAPDQRAS